jgi:hypothetical protein
MEDVNIDKKFYREALNALKSFGHKEFTTRFLKKIDLPVKDGLALMWNDIDDWLEGGKDIDCINLLEYVDDLKMWGKQRIYLFNIENKDTIKKLSDEIQIKQLDKVRKVFDNPIYEWQLYKPTLVHVKKAKDSQTNDSLLIFKFIELRKFDFEENGAIQTSEERSTNYFIINLSKGYAELRLQQLPTRAHLNYRKEYNLFITEISKYLGVFYNSFKPLALDKVMYTMVQRPIFRITGITFVSGRKSSEPTSTILLIINRLFSNPRITYVAGYWRCKQEILGKLRLYFSLYGNSNSIDIGGIADPNKIRDLIQKIVDIHNDNESSSRPNFKPLMDKLYLKLYGQPKAQAVILSAGAIAAFLIWIIMDGVGNYLFEEWIQKFLGSIPFIVPKIIIEILWIFAYYGYRRTIRSFMALRYLSPIQLLKTIKDAKKNKDIIGEKFNVPISSHYN